MASSEYLIHIPNWHPHTLNKLSTCHWAVRNKRKTADRQMIAVYGLHVPKASQKRHVSFEVGLLRGREPDPDAYYKSVLDGLKQCGMIVDDSSKWLSYDMPTFTRGVKYFTIKLKDADKLQAT